MLENILGVVVVVAILWGCAVVTNWYARNAYNVCLNCHTLNAKRRHHCRECGQPIGEKTGGDSIDRDGQD